MELHVAIYLMVNFRNISLPSWKNTTDIVTNQIRKDCERLRRNTNGKRLEEHAISLTTLTDGRTGLFKATVTQD